MLPRVEIIHKRSILMPNLVRVILMRMNGEATAISTGKCCQSNIWSLIISFSKGSRDYFEDLFFLLLNMLFYKISVRVIIKIIELSKKFCYLVLLYSRTMTHDKLIINNTKLVIRVVILFANLKGLNMIMLPS